MITDKMVEAAWRVATGAQKVGAGDGNTYVVSVPTREDMRAALEAADAATWRPISEAPKDGTHVLVVDIGDPGIVVASFRRGGWLDSQNGYDVEPNQHFRPLPSPPKGTSHDT
jgi:hypothetical protein